MILERKLKQLREKYLVKTDISFENNYCDLCRKNINLAMRYLCTEVGDVCSFDCLLSYDENEYRKTYEEMLHALEDLLTIANQQYPLLNRKLKGRVRQVRGIVTKAKAM